MNRNQLDIAEALRYRMCAEDEEAALARIEQAMQEKLVADRSPRRGTVRLRLRRPSLRFVPAVVAFVVATTGVAVAANPGFLTDLNVFGEPTKSNPSGDATDSLELLRHAVVDTPAGFERMGTPQLEKKRVVLSHDEDGISVEIVATPTDTDDICFTSVIRWANWPSHGGSGGCLPGFEEDWPVKTMVRSSVGPRPVAYGLTPDGVRAVAIVTATGTHEATMGENAYFWLGSDRAETPTAIEITTKGGDTIRQAVPQPIPPKEIEDVTYDGPQPKG